MAELVARVVARQARAPGAQPHAGLLGDHQHVDGAVELAGARQQVSVARRARGAVTTPKSETAQPGAIGHGR